MQFPTNYLFNLLKKINYDIFTGQLTKLTKFIFMAVIKDNMKLIRKKKNANRNGEYRNGYSIEIKSVLHLHIGHAVMSYVSSFKKQQS